MYENRRMSEESRVSKRTEEEGSSRRQAEQISRLDAYRSDLAIGGIWLIVFLGSIFVQSPWEQFHGIIFLLVGALVCLFPPIRTHPKLWWGLAIVFVLGGLSSFLPANWFEPKDWRGDLDSVGVDTGSLVVVQGGYALESLSVFFVILFTGLWMAGHRASRKDLRIWSLMFVWGVAAYAIASWSIQHFTDTGPSSFGFFPNRNHTATYLAMGAVCGLGCILQAIRDKRYMALVAALVATGICLWAAGAWSISRAGIFLIAVGTLLWVFLLGKRYLGRHGIWAVCLLVLGVAGMFLILDSKVKQRITDTVDRSGAVVGGSQEHSQAALVDLDFRIPTALDTLDLIGENIFTGVGAGQYEFIFPQYRNLTSVASDATNVHPESDWLWMASEIGVPGTVALGILVVLALGTSLRSILRGRDRALRSACLVGAALVPFHGIFDVPGHRITLAFSAIFLYTLSLGSLSTRSSSPLPRKIPYRIMGVAVGAFTLTILSLHMLGKISLRTVASERAISEAQRLYRADEKLQKAAEAADAEYQPDPSEDPLEDALAILENASHQVPLDRQIPRAIASVAFNFDDKQDEIDRAFALGRKLDPTWVRAPYEQGIAWAEFDPERVLPLWEEALERAEHVTELDDNNMWSRKNTLDKMELFSEKHPALRGIIEQLKR